MKKICVYAICKNEKSNVEKWLTSMNEADYIVVLDTGSTDGTYEMLQNDPRVTTVKQKVITPWRFDVARNESMSLVPEDADILVCTDFDEIFIEGWASFVRDSFSEEFSRLYYLYAWSHDEKGNPKLVFTYDKIHRRGYHWSFPVHEVLFPDNSAAEKILKIEGTILLHHYPDNEKVRPYFDLLKLRCEENPHDPLSFYLYARELGHMQRWEESAQMFLETLNKKEIEDFPLIKAGCYSLLGDLYMQINDVPKAEYYFLQLYKFDPTYREPYLQLAEICNKQHHYMAARDLVIRAFEKGVRHYDWTEREESWLAQPYDILSICDYYLGYIDEGIQAVQQVLQYRPNDQRIQKNYIALLEKKIELGVNNNGSD